MIGGENLHRIDFSYPDGFKLEMAVNLNRREDVLHVTDWTVYQCDDSDTNAQLLIEYLLSFYSSVENYYDSKMELDNYGCTTSCSFKHC